MVLNDRQQIRDLLRETVTMLCKRGLSYNAQLSVEGLLGITVDDNEVFLVNIKETVHSPISPHAARAQHELTESLPSSAEDSPPMGDGFGTDIVSRAVTPMHTFRSGRKQRSRKRTWASGDKQQDDVSVQAPHDSSSALRGPPQKQQAVGSPSVTTAISTEHTIIKQESTIQAADEEQLQSQNFDDSIASNSADSVDQQDTEVSHNGAEARQWAAACKLPLAVAVESNQRDVRSPADAMPGCSAWVEPADGTPSSRSHTLSGGSCSPHAREQNGVDALDDSGIVTVQPEAPEEVGIVMVQPKAPEESDMVTVQPDSPEETSVVTVQPEAPEDSDVVTVEPEAPEEAEVARLPPEHPQETGIVTVEPEAPEEPGIIMVQPEAPEEGDFMAGKPGGSEESNLANVQRESRVDSSVAVLQPRAMEEPHTSEILPQPAIVESGSCSAGVTPKQPEPSNAVSVQPTAAVLNSHSPVQPKSVGQALQEMVPGPVMRPDKKQQPSAEKSTLEEGEIVSPGTVPPGTLESLGISAEQLAAAGLVLPIPGMTNPLGMNEVALSHLNHGNHTNFSELQQNLLWYAQCMEAAGANAAAANNNEAASGQDGGNLHAGMQMLRCRTCGKQLSSARSLMLHENRHKGIYPFHCPICGKGFASNYNMRGHMAHHTNVREFKCHLCAAEYVYKQPLQKHYEKAHGIDIGYTELPIMRRVLPQ